MQNKQEPTVIRANAEAEEIKGFRGHKGICRYCDGMVKMRRDPSTLRLEPAGCWCLKCGQRYWVAIDVSLGEFELQQWKEKQDDESGI